MEAVESGDKNRDVTDHIFRAPCMFCKKKGLGKFNAKDVEISRNWSVHEFYRLKALITLKQMNTSVVAKDKNLYVQNFDGEADWSGVVNFHCM